MNFEHSKQKGVSTQGRTLADLPEGSQALTIRQLELLRYRKEQCSISDEEYMAVVRLEGGVLEDIKIPFVKVADVLGGLDWLSDFKKALNYKGVGK